MCNVRNLTRSCGSPLPPGTKLKLYVIPKDEITAWPQTEAEANAGTDLGDKKTLAEAFTYTTDVGKGFWRAVDILVDTGNLRNVMEGEFGGQGYRQRLDFFIQGNGAPELEWADDMLACSGCLIAMIEDKAGNRHVLGDLDNPVFLEAAEGGSGGDRVGYQYTLYANTGKMPYIYGSALAINLTPNP